MWLVIADFSKKKIDIYFFPILMPCPLVSAAIDKRENSSDTAIFITIGPANLFTLLVASGASTASPSWPDASDPRTLRAKQDINKQKTGLSRAYRYENGCNDVPSMTLTWMTRSDIYNMTNQPLGSPPH